VRWNRKTNVSKLICVVISFSIYVGNIEVKKLKKMHTIVLSIPEISRNDLRRLECQETNIKLLW